MPEPSGAQQHNGMSGDVCIHEIEIRVMDANRLDLIRSLIQPFAHLLR